MGYKYRRQILFETLSNAKSIIVRTQGPLFRLDIWGERARNEGAEKLLKHLEIRWQTFKVEEEYERTRATFYCYLLSLYDLST